VNPLRPTPIQCFSNCLFSAQSQIVDQAIYFGKANSRFPLSYRIVFQFHSI